MNKLFICFSTFLLMMALNSAPTVNAAAEGAFVSTPSGLEYKDFKVGRGKKAEGGDTAVIHFVGWLSDGERQGKEIFNSRKQKKEPVSFVIGTDGVMSAWNEGVLGMQPGGRRLLRIPPHLGYGAKGVVDVVPPHAPLIFIIELLELK